MAQPTSQNVTAWHAEISKIDEQIAALQESKKQAYSKIRRDFDRRTAEAMKVCMRLAAMDERQRAERLQFDELGLSFLMMLQPKDQTAQARSVSQPDNDDWRRQRELDRATDFDDDLDENVDEEDEAA